jgi:tellurite resistance protein TerC
MSLQTIEQVRRVFRVVAGFTLLAVGVVMLVTPGPGWLVILFGLSLLAAEFIWARRLMDRIKRQGERVKDVVWSYIPSRGASSQHPVDAVADKQPGPEPVSPTAS